MTSEAHPGWQHVRYTSLAGITVTQDVCVTCGWRLWNSTSTGDRHCHAATRSAHECRDTEDLR